MQARYDNMAKVVEKMNRDKHGVYKYYKFAAFQIKGYRDWIDKVHPRVIHHMWPKWDYDHFKKKWDPVSLYGFEDLLWLMRTCL